MRDPIVIVDYLRTPMGSFQGTLKDISAPDLAATCLRILRERLDTQQITVDEVMLGCVLSAGVGQAPARQALLKAGFPQETPAVLINKVCGSGMKAVMMAAQALSFGDEDCIIAGGMESMSRAPYLLEKARSGYRMGHGKLIDHMFLDGLEDAYTPGTLMGTFADQTAKAYGFSREDLDAYALTTIERGQKAMSSGIFAKETTPVLASDGSILLQNDELIAKAKPEKIPNLKPAFGKDGLLTAAHSSGISDGAAALVLMRQSTAHARNLPIRAILSGYAQHSHAPENFITAPIGAVKKLLSKLSWSTNQVDLWEINEAFALVPMTAMKDLDIAIDRVNVHGGACVLGHPLGATGARILVTLLNAMETLDVKRGIASPCIGGGEAVAVALERP